jgi:uncharacterized protein (TIGR02217 family)
MSITLTSVRDQARWAWVPRFDPSRWTVDFPRPMLAALTTQGGDALKVTLSFQRTGDLAGLIWDSADRWSPPLLAHATNRDYRGLLLQFRWQSSGALMPLDAVNGPTLTLEGRDASGAPRAWYVRLWNYAVGTPTDAIITLDFDDLDGGFLLPAEADPVWAGDIDRLFISLVPSSYLSGGTTALGSGPQAASVTLSQIKVDGAGAMLECGDAYTPAHTLGIANGYDDVYHVAPERLVRQMHALGYRGTVDHYVGMSHSMRLAWDAGAAAFLVQPSAPVLDAAAIAWHADFFDWLKTFDMDVLLSVSFEVLEQHCPAAWQQKRHDGVPARTGWSPPSNLLSPTNSAAMAYVKDVMLAFCGLATTANLPVRVQVGEPWWWVPETAPRAPCLYDAATVAAYGQAPPVITDMDAPLSAAQLAFVDWCGAQLGAAVLALKTLVLAAYPSAEVTTLIYLPAILDAQVKRLNLPLSWAKPAFPYLQIEDYGWVTAGNWGAHAAGISAVQSALGYSPAETDYLGGFVLSAADKNQWQAISQALSEPRGWRRRYVWAWPQVARDGALWAGLEEENLMQGFHDVRFPLALGFGSKGGPEFATSVTTSASGRETRSIGWAQARRRYDVGTGLRADADLATLLGFFEARRGRAYAFRFTDPLDHRSGAHAAAVTPLDQLIGTGDGTRLHFQLSKGTRPITKPVVATVRVAVAGVERTSGWSVDGLTGIIAFTTAPLAGQVVSAGFQFDVPVRFADDTLAISAESLAAGEAPGVPLIEVMGI